MSERWSGLGGVRPYREVAAFYADHRQMISRPFAAMLAEVEGWTTDDRLVDLGAGPAMIARRLAPFVREVVAVDPEPDMLEEGMSRSRRDGLDNVTCLVGSSDDLAGLGRPAQQFRGIVIGSALHWMADQDAVLRRLEGYVDEADGSVIIVGWDVGAPAVEVPGVDRRPWREREPWTIVSETLRHYLADAPPGPHPRGRHDPFGEILARSAFSDIRFLRWEYEQEVTPNVRSAIEYEYTISHTLARLGDRRPDFEAEVASQLAAADLGPVRERRVDSALIARRPRRK